MTAPIVAVLTFYGGENVPQSGGWRKVKCPFHDDRVASASVNPALNGFKCHACDIKGDVFSIVMGQEGVSFAEAIGRVQEITGDDDLTVRGEPEPGSNRILGRKGTGAKRDRALPFGNGKRLGRT